MFPRAFILLGLLAGAHVVLLAQGDSLVASPWLDREFRYWRGDPPMHDPSGAEISGYTDEERRMTFFRDHRYQEIVLENHGEVGSPIWSPGGCGALQGDTAAVLTGTWSWMNDTLHVTVEHTAEYPLDDVLAQYHKRSMDKPFDMPRSPARVCTTQRNRLFWFEGKRLSEDARTWH